MYTDLAEAVEDLKKKGYENLFEPDGDVFFTSKLGLREEVQNIKISGTWQFDQGTDPGDESTLYALETKGGVKGYIITSYGAHVDPEKARLVDRLLSSQK